VVVVAGLSSANLTQKRIKKLLTFNHTRLKILIIITIDKIKTIRWALKIGQTNFKISMCVGSRGPEHQLMKTEIAESAIDITDRTCQMVKYREWTQKFSKTI
jgi:hypothetical protein